MKTSSSFVCFDINKIDRFDKHSKRCRKYSLSSIVPNWIHQVRWTIIAPAVQNHLEETSSAPNYVNCIVSKSTIQRTKSMKQNKTRANMGISHKKWQKLANHDKMLQIREFSICQKADPIHRCKSGLSCLKCKKNDESIAVKTLLVPTNAFYQINKSQLRSFALENWR